jgi:hypothetical protein
MHIPAEDRDQVVCGECKQKSIRAMKGVYTFFWKWLARCMRCTRFSPGQYIIDSVVISGMLMEGHDRQPGMVFVRGVSQWKEKASHSRSISSPSHFAFWAMQAVRLVVGGARIHLA